MKVLLFDADLKMPNLALMKLSTWHKRSGDQVELNFPLGEYDLCYASCVFTKNKSRPKGSRRQHTYLDEIPFEGVITGGIGSGNDAVLNPVAEHLMPDYSLYPRMNYSLGFTTRGCIRNCPWCVVPQKEGWIKPWAEIGEFWNRHHSKIVLLDNNLLAAPNWRDTLGALAREKVTVDFNQGLDIRLVDDEVAWFLKQIKFGRYLRFAFDEPSMEQRVREGILILEQTGIPPSRLSFYILIGFNTQYAEDFERVKILESYACDVFAMIYQEVNGVKPRVPWDGPGKLQEFGRWINVKKIHRHMTYKEWLRIRKVGGK